MSDQLRLFAQELPGGLHYVEDFISPAMEAGLIRQVAALPLQPFQFGPYEGKRRVASFGFSYDYERRRLRQAEPIPGWLEPVIAQIERRFDANVEQVLCTEYEVGTGIGWHKDKPHFDRVFGLSLGSACRLRFRRPANRGLERFTLEAQPRSLYVMSGPSRHDWQHSIPPVEAPRISITFRTMLQKT